MADPIRFRSARLVVGILGYVYDADEPIPWLELVDAFADGDHPWKTVENTIYDLVSFGALHRIGKPGDRRHPDSRALKATPLGRAWLAAELLPRPGEPVPEDPSPLADAEAIAERLGEEFLEG